MKNLLLGVALLSLANCSHPALMTYQTYDEIHTGTTVGTLTQEVGHPYAIHAKEGGIEEYEYIERIDNGMTLVSENHYFIIVKDGEVIGKYVKREGPPAYDLIYQDEPNYPGYP